VSDATSVVRLRLMETASNVLAGDCAAEGTAAATAMRNTPARTRHPTAFETDGRLKRLAKPIG